MKKKFFENKFVKRAISTLLCTALIIGGIQYNPGRREVEAATEPATLSAENYQTKNVKINLIPTHVSTNGSLMNSYVKTQNSGNLSSNALFKATSYKNIRKATKIYKGKALSRDTVLKHNGNDHWYATYKWNLGSNYPVFKELMKSGQISIGYQGELTSDKHSNFVDHWKKKWDIATMEISASGTTLISKKSAKKNDGQAQSFSQVKRISSGSNISQFTFHANHSGCNCGSSAVARTAIWFVDNVAPKITDTYVSYDLEGKNRITGSDQGISYSVEDKRDIYITLEFSEYIRFADDNPEVLTLKVDAFGTTTGQEEKNAGIAKLVKLQDKKMIFKYSVPNDTTTNFYVTGISAAQDWIGKDVKAYMRGIEGNPYTKFSYTIQSKITDLAGNALDWNAGKSQLKFDEKYYVDNVQPTLEKINISGTMINDDSTTVKKENEWPADIDRSAVFAGPNDEIDFTLYFSEAFPNLPNSLSDIKAYLNLSDGGEQVSVSIKSYATTTRKAFFGEDETEEPVGYLQTERLKITDTMVPMNADGTQASGTALDGTPIRITKITGMENVTDYRGNKLVSVATKVDKVPAQQEYLDVKGASAVTTLTPVTEASDTYYDMNTMETFRIPIKVDDDTSVDGGKGNYASGTTGLKGRFYIVMDSLEGDTGSCGYYYQTEESSTKKVARMGYNENDSTKVDFVQLGGAESNEILIELMDLSYNYGTGSVFTGTMFVETEDYAGNKKTQEFRLRYEADLEAAEVKIVDDSLDYVVNTNKIEVTTSVKVQIEDRFGVEKVEVQWSDETAPVEYDLSSFTAKELKNFTIEPKHVETITIPADGVVGKTTRSVTISVTDKKGRLTQITSETFSFTYEKPKSNYTMFYYQGALNDRLGVNNAYTFSQPIEPWDDQPVVSSENSAEKPASYVRIQVDKPLGTPVTRTLVFLDAGDGTYYTRAASQGNGVLYNDVKDAFGMDQIFSTYEGYSSGSSAIALTYQWYKLTGSIQMTANEVGTGNFTKIEALSDTAEVVNLIQNCYGQLPMYIVTSDKFANTTAEIFKEDGTLEFGGTENPNTVIEKEVVYMATSTSSPLVKPVVDKDYNLVATVTAPDGTDLSAKTKVNPIASLDNAAISFKLENLLNTETVQYGANTISKIEVKLYKGSTSSEDNVVYKWENLEPAMDYTVTVPEGVVTEAATYYVYVYVQGINNIGTAGTLPLYVCPETEGLVWQAYNKSYTHSSYMDGDSKLSYNVANVKNDQGIAELTIGLAQDPEGWTSTSAFTFVKGTLSNTEYKTLDTKFRIWNAADDKAMDHLKDAAGTGTEGWFNFNGHDSWEYTPVLVSSFTENCYGNQQIPLTSGMNTLIYEVKNINGMIERHRIYVNVVDKIDEFSLAVTEDYDATESFVDAYTIVPNLSTAMQAAGTSNVTFKEIPIGNAAAGTWVDSTNTDVFQGFKYTAAGSYEYILYDANGNMTAQKYTIDDYDKEAPTITVTDLADTDGLGISQNTFNLKVTVGDNKGVDLENIQLTFDAAYSQLLKGADVLEGEDANQQVSMTIPMREFDGEKIWWNGFETGNNGIFLTMVTENKTVNGYDIELWGVVKYDESKAEVSTRDVARDLTFTVYDASGRSTSDSITIKTTNVKPTLTLDEPNGILSTVPIASVDNYDAGEMAFFVNGNKETETSLNGIQYNGKYDIDYTDMFGTTYRQQMEITGFSNDYVEFILSETEPTNQNVVVSAVNKKTLYPNLTIESITAEDPSVMVSTSIDAETDTASIVMSGNGRVIVTLVDKTNANNPLVKAEIFVGNIDKVLEPAQLVWQYSGGSEPTFIDEAQTSVAAPVTAIVIAEEDEYGNSGGFLEGVNGSLEYDFEAGSTKGQTYTFEYKDEAGNTGTITATLEYNVGELEEETSPTEDTEAPEYTLELLAKRNGVFGHIASLTKVENIGVSGEVESINVSGADVNGLAQDYIAQAYALNFVIDDMSATKLILKNAGSAAPTSYADTSDTIDGVTLNGTMINIDKNAKFDVYVVDEKDYVTALTGINITTVDTQAPEVKINYSAYTDANGYGVVEAVFEVAGNETIIPLVDEVVARVLIDEGTGNPIKDTDGNSIIQYYWEIRDNGVYEFKYQDIYGNGGMTKVTIEGLDNTAPYITTIVWHTDNVYTINWAKEQADGNTLKDLMNDPENNRVVQGQIINRDAEMELNLNKPVKSVQILDENGNAVDLAAEGIRIEFAERTARVIFTKNTGAAKPEQLYTVEVMANGNDVKAKVEVPMISCIDKTAPNVQSDGGTLSANHLAKTYTFTTDTWAYNRDCEYADAAAEESRTTHKWTVYKNGTYTLVFSDKAGNSTKFEVIVDDIDDKVLTLSYSKSADGSGAVSNPAELDVRLGHTFYVSVNKNAKLTWLGQSDILAAAGTWTQLTVPTEAGFYALKAEDSVTGRIIYSNIAIQLRDKVAPTITFDEKTVYLEDTASIAVMETVLKQGVTVQDNQTKNMTFTYTGAPDTVKAGVYTITYKAQDEDGNIVTELRTLYIYSGDKLIVDFNGSQMEPYGTRIVSGDEIKINVDYDGEGDLVIMYKEGIKTTGQMKYNSTRINNGDALAVEKGKFYSVYVRTQDRTEMVFYLFVEE